MQKDNAIHKLQSSEKPPHKFTFPHCYTPHPMVVQAAEEVKATLQQHPEWSEEISQGKMFGVLVCDGPCYLAAFSGTLGGKTRQDGFVEPVYDLMAKGSYFKQEESIISKLAKSIP